MAETKPKKSKKTTAKATEDVVEVVEEIKEGKKVTQKPADRRKSVKIELNEMIAVRSVTKGGLTYISPKTGFEVTWDDYDTEEYIEFGELLTMKASKGKFLNEPFIIIDDEDVVEKLGLTSLYENMVDVDNIENFYKQNLTTMEKQLEKMPRGIKKLVGDKARELIQSEELHDIRKIKLLEQKLHLDLQMLLD